MKSKSTDVQIFSYRAATSNASHEYGETVSKKSVNLLRGRLDILIEVEFAARESEKCRVETRIDELWTSREASHRGRSSYFRLKLDGVRRFGPDITRFRPTGVVHAYPARQPRIIGSSISYQLLSFITTSL